jgi:alpha-L-fucosidase
MKRAEGGVDMKNQSIENFFDARFGLFIHWGLYSLLAGEWQGKRMDDIGEWIMSYHKIPIAEYEKLTEQFNPTAFDAEAIVTMAKAAGMNYLVITSKHHEGFALFHSKADPYNVVDATPFGRDIIAELAQACRKHDMKFGLYYSQALDWHERNAGGWDDPAYTQARRPWGNIWDFPDPAGKDFEEYFTRKVLPQVTELLTRYGDIFLLWFDTPRTITTEQSKRLYDLVKSLQPDCLVNSRIGNGLGDYASLGDNQLPAIPLAVPSESPVTLNDTWGYKYYDHAWKDSRNIIDKLVRLAAKNANFLLNIGPRGDGSIPEETVRILSEVEKWTSRNREGLFGTRGSPAPHDFLWGSMTSRETHLYCFVDDNQKDKLTINGLINQVRQVTALDSGRPVPFSQTALLDSTSLTIDLVPTQTYRPAYRIDFDTAPMFSKRILMQDRGSLALYPHLAAASLAGKTYQIPLHGLGDRYKKVTSVAISSAGTLVGWTDPDLALSWDAWITAQGSYKVQLQMPAQYNQEPVRLSHRLTLSTEQEDGSSDATWPFVLDSGLAEADVIVTLQPGPCRLTLRLAALEADRAMALQCIVLTPQS